MRAEKRFKQMPLPLPDQAAQAEDLAVAELEVDAVEDAAGQRIGWQRNATAVAGCLGGKEFESDSRPVISRTASPSDSSLVSATAISSPLRSTATRLQKCTTSSQRCEMKRTILPSRRRRSTKAASHSTSAPPSAEVASSSSRTRGLAFDRADDFEHLLPAEGQVADARARRDVERVAGEDSEAMARVRARSMLRHGVTGERVSRRFCSTVSSRTRVSSWKTLAMPSVKACMGTARRERPAIEAQHAAVGRDDPADDLDQRRLAGTILADQAEDRAGHSLEAHGFERLRRAVGLVDFREAQHGGSLVPYRRLTPADAGDYRARDRRRAETLRPARRFSFGQSLRDGVIHGEAEIGARNVGVGVERRR